MHQILIGIKHPVHSMKSTTSNGHIPIFTAIKSLMYANFVSMYQPEHSKSFMFYL